MKKLKIHKLITRVKTMFKNILVKIFDPTLIVLYITVGFFVFLVSVTPSNEFERCVSVVKNNISGPVNIDIMERITKMCADVTLSRD
jgi:hypothetical protein